jgi:hypothetical protein
MGDGTATFLGLSAGLEIDVEGQAMKILIRSGFAGADQQQDNAGHATAQHGNDCPAMRRGASKR